MAVVVVAVGTAVVVAVAEICGLLVAVVPHT
jgi:hypothetical protein